MTTLDLEEKNTGFKILWDHKKTVFLYTNNENSEMKLRISFAIASKRILRNKFNNRHAILAC